MSKNKRKNQKRNDFRNVLYYKAKPKEKELKLYRNIVGRAKIESIIFDCLLCIPFIISVALWLYYNLPEGIYISIFTLFPLISLMKNYQFPITDKFSFYSELGLCECCRRDRTKEILLYYEKLPEFSFDKKNIFQKLFYRHQKFGKLLVFSFGSKKRKFDRKYEIIKSYKDKNVKLAELIKTQLPRPILIDLEDKISKTDINNANVFELQKLPFIDKDTSAKIVMRVNNEGPFADMWDLAEFIELEQEDMEKLLKLVYIEPPKESVPDFIRQLQDSAKNIATDNSLDI